MNAELRWIKAALDDDPTVRVVVLTGSGDQFCVGADTKALDFYKETDQTYGDTLHTSEMATPGHGAHPQFDHDLVWQGVSVSGSPGPIRIVPNGLISRLEPLRVGAISLRRPRTCKISRGTVATLHFGLQAEPASAKSMLLKLSSMERRCLR